MGMKLISLESLMDMIVIQSHNMLRTKRDLFERRTKLSHLVMNCERCCVY